MLYFLLGLIVLGVLWYIVETYLPMPAPMLLIVRLVFLVIVVLYIVQGFNLAPFPRLR